MYNIASLPFSNWSYLQLNSNPLCHFPGPSPILSFVVFPKIIKSLATQENRGSISAIHPVQAHVPHSDGAAPQTWAVCPSEPSPARVSGMCTRPCTFRRPVPSWSVQRVRGPQDSQSHTTTYRPDPWQTFSSRWEDGRKHIGDASNISLKQIRKKVINSSQDQ